MTDRTALVIAAALRVEALALRGAVPGARVIRTGMGPRRAAAAATGLAGSRVGGLAVAGLCAGLDPLLGPGSVVVASEVRGPDGMVRCDRAGALVEALEGRGLHPRLGPLVSVDHLVQGGERARLLATGAIAADMESAFLAGAAAGGPFGVLRVVVDAPGRELKRPGLAAAAVRALWTLRRAAPALQDWSAGNAATIQSASRNAVIPKEVT
jgi:4-hydroxy-3-methylbut-2-enyl diphosphate reductase